MPSVNLKSRSTAGLRRRAVDRRRYVIFRNPQAAADVDLINGLVADERFFRFRTPLEVNEEKHGGYYCHSAAALDLTSHGRTRAESWDSFIALFENDWDQVAMVADSELDKGAKALKKSLLRLVESVDEVR